jgi:L-iditol 2-dehydrogenase
MKALAKLAPGPGHLSLVERPSPVPATGQVLLEVHASGVCSTDLQIASGEYATVTPVTLGHEVSGVVKALGPDVDADWQGRHVVAETYFSTCTTCDRCRDGRPNLCPDRRSIGIHVDGGFADLLALPAANLHEVPDGVGPYAAALAEPLACVCNCLLDPPAIQSGDRVVVTGPGPIGLLAAQVARDLGGTVTVCGLRRDSERLTVARALGFAVRDTPPESGSADVAVECSGSAGGAAACLTAARRGGRHVQIGVFADEVTVPLNQVFYSELVLTSGFASTPRSWRHAMRLIDSRAVQTAPLVTRAAPLAAWEDVFADLTAARGIKVVLDPRL